MQNIIESLLLLFYEKRHGRVVREILRKVVSSKSELGYPTTENFSLSTPQ